MFDIFANEFKIKYNSIISNLFYGTLETKAQCQKCRNIKYNFQIFSFIEFPLEKVSLYCFNSGKRNNYNMLNNKNPDVDLYECFEYNNNLELKYLLPLFLLDCRPRIYLMGNNEII